MKKIMKKLLFCIALVVLSGCVSIKSVPYETRARTPKPDDFPIEIVESKNITKPYKVIGLVQVNAGKKHSVADTLEKLRSAARQLGADALIDFSNQPIGAGVLHQLAERSTLDMYVISGRPKQSYGNSPTIKSRRCGQGIPRAGRECRGRT